MNKKILEKIINEKLLISICINQQDFDDSMVGFVDELFEDRFTIKEIDEFGRFIGKTIILLKDVTYLEYDSIYLRKLKYICNNSNFDFTSSTYIHGKGEELYQYIKELKFKQIITVFFVDDHYVHGIIVEINDSTFLIKNIGIDGLDDGFSVYNIEDIVGLRYGGLSEQKIELLQKSNF